MSRSRNAAELCALIVDEIYGELTSRIFTLLLRRGRLPIPALAQYSRLTPRQLRHGLVVLIQQNLAYYHKDRETGVTYYEANQDAAYFLLRTGKIIEITESRFGTIARDIVQNLLLLGHTKIADLVDAYKSKWDTNQIHVNGDGNGPPLTNGMHNGANGNLDAVRLSNLDDVLCQLLETELIEPVVESMLLSPSDTYHKVEQEILQRHFGGSTKGIKQKDELKSKVIDGLRAIRQERKTWPTKGGKRPAGVHMNGHQKRQKLANGDDPKNFRSYENQDEHVGLDRDLVVRVNYEKYTVLLRNQRLVALVAHDIGETTSQVYAELLRLLEEKIPRCKRDPAIDGAEEEREGLTVTTMELSRALSNSINPAIGIGKVSSDKVNTSLLERSRKKRKQNFDEPESIVEGHGNSDEDETEDEDDIVETGNIEEIDQDSDIHREDAPENFPVVKKSTRQARVTFEDMLTKAATVEDRQSKLIQIKKHLQLLTEHTRRFVCLCGSRGMGEWTVDFQGLVEFLKETELDTIISENFGAIGKRIVQILRHKGKLDEKQVQKFGLLKQKDVRTKLVEMQMAGFMEIQEVPRDNNRTPSRTIFLWFFDVNRVMAIIQESIYKAMSRCFQVLEVEKVGVAAILDRTDIKGREEELLDKKEFNELRVIREKEERVLTQIARLDDLVSIFLDF